MSDGLARKGFDGDLADGELREDAFARLLLSGRELWEHKRDYQAVQTGNLAIEYQTSQRSHGQGDIWRSGINDTSGWWWVHEFAPDCRLVVPVRYMKQLARLAIKWEPPLTKWIGDNDRFHNALIPWKWVLQPPEVQE